MLTRLKCFYRKSNHIKLVLNMINTDVVLYFMLTKISLCISVMHDGYDAVYVGKWTSKYVLGQYPILSNFQFYMYKWCEHCWCIEFSDLCIFRPYANEKSVSE